MKGRRSLCPTLFYLGENSSNIEPNLDFSKGDNQFNEGEWKKTQVHPKTIM